MNSIKEINSSNPQKKSIVIQIFLLLFFFLFAATGISNIGTLQKQQTYFFVSIINYRNLSLAVIFLTAIIFDNQFLNKFFSNKNHSKFILAFFYLLILGIFSQNDIKFIVLDVSIFLHFYAGIFFFRGLIKSSNFRFNLIFFTSLIISLGHLILISRASISIGDLLTEERFYDEASNFYSCYGYVVLSYCLMIAFYSKLDLLGFLLRLLVAYSVYIILYDNLLINMTRSSSINIFFSLFLSLNSILFFTYDDKQKKIKRRKIELKELIIIVFFIAIFLYILSNFLNYDQILTSDLSELGIMKRFTGTQEYKNSDTGSLRLQELGELFEYLSDPNGLGGLGYFMGTGIGSAYYSPTLTYIANTPHISIFTFLLKGGLFLFIPIILFVYLWLPFIYLRTFLFFPKKLASNTKSANILVLPGVLSWSVFPVISGGLSDSYLMALGILFASYLHIKENGLQEIFK